MAKRRGNGEGTVRRRKDGRYEGRVMIGRKPDGRPDYRFVYGDTEAEALDRLLELRMQLKRGTLPKGKPQTLAQYVETWWPYYRENGNNGEGLRARTVETYMRVWEDHIRPHLGNRKLKDIDAQALRNLYARIQATVQAKSNGRFSGKRTAEQAHRFLHLVFESAVVGEQIPRNPCDLLLRSERPKTHPYKNRPEFTREEAMQALQAVEGTPYYPAFLLAMVTGMRRNELLGLAWKHVDLLNGQITVERQIHFEKGGTWTFGPPKTKAGVRVVPIPEDVAALLATLKTSRDAGEEDFVVCWEDGRPMRHDALDRKWREVRESLGFHEKMVLHDLRAAWITWAAEAGANVKAVAQAAGHADEVVTLRIYQNVTKKMERAVAGAFKGFVPPTAQA